MTYSEVRKAGAGTVISRYAYDGYGRRAMEQDAGGEVMRTLYDGFGFEEIRRGVTIMDGSFTTRYATETVRPVEKRDEGMRYRWLGDTNGGIRNGGEEKETAAAARYTGIQAALYARGEAVGLNRTASTGTCGGSVYLGKDILGSVRSSSNEYGVLEDRYEYDAFGKPYKGEFGDGMNLGYTGKPYDVATGMYNYGYRDYSPEVARFTTEDPIRDGINWFAYVNDDPVNWIDPWGLEINFIKGTGATNEDVESAIRMSNNIANSGTHSVELWNELYNDPNKTITVVVNGEQKNTATPGNNITLNPIEAIASAIGIGGDVYVEFDPNDSRLLSTANIPNDPESTLFHEVVGHGYPMAYGKNPITEKGREVKAATFENEYRANKGLQQLPNYVNEQGKIWAVPQFNIDTSKENQCSD
jgi:RHS repeat-associated protein